MNTADDQPHHFARKPDYACAAPKAETRRSADQSDGVCADQEGWLLGCVIDGLLHLACANVAVHPGLLDCIEQRAQTRAMAQESRS